MESKEFFTPEKRWNYEQFKEYLLALTGGEQFLLPLDQYSKEIELSQDWHKVLNTMREGTNKDHIERVSLVGFSRARRTLYLPSGTAHGWEKDAPVGKFALLYQKFQQQFQDIQGSIGILHSHPPRDIRVLGFTIATQGGLSQGDLYIALTSGHGPFIGVADGNRNIFAFKTRDSIKPGESFEAFRDKPRQKTSPLENDRVIAKQYKLALYVGSPNRELQRVDL